MMPLLNNASVGPGGIMVQLITRPYLSFAGRWMVSITAKARLLVPSDGTKIIVHEGGRQLEIYKVPFMRVIPLQ